MHVFEKFSESHFFGFAFAILFFGPVHETFQRFRILFECLVPFFFPLDFLKQCLDREVAQNPGKGLNMKSNCGLHIRQGFFGSIALTDDDAFQAHRVGNITVRVFFDDDFDSFHLR